jgi:hypothetical protein
VDSLTCSLTHLFTQSPLNSSHHTHSLTHSLGHRCYSLLAARFSFDSISDEITTATLSLSLTLTLTHTHTKQIHTWYIPATPLFFTVIIIIVSNANGIISVLIFTTSCLPTTANERKRYLLPASVRHSLTYALTLCALSRARNPKKTCIAHQPSRQILDQGIIIEQNRIPSTHWQPLRKHNDPLPLHSKP